MTVLENPMRLLAGDNIMRQAMVWAVVFAVCWGALEIAVSADLRAPYSVLQIVWCRYAAHLCVALFLWGWRRPKVLLSTSRPASQIFRSFLMVVMPCAFALAVQRGVPADFVWSVFWVAPALIIIFASFFLKERPPLSVAGMSVAGAVASAAIFGHLQPPSLTAVALALAFAGSFSLYVVMTRSLRKGALEANMFYTAIVPFVVLTPVLPHIWIWPSAHDAVVLAAIGTIGFLALFALDEACRAAPVWGSAGAFFTQALFVAFVLTMVSGVAPRLRVDLGMASLAAIVGMLWLWADRFKRSGLDLSRA